MSFITTPHINAEADAFGKTVLMPGDPLRSKFIAENYLENAKLVNNVRGIQGYTGTYKGTKVSVMASGMGMPTIGIYSYELFTVFFTQPVFLKYHRHTAPAGYLSCIRLLQSGNHTKQRGFAAA